MKLAWARRAQATGAVVRFVEIPPDPQSPEDIIERVAAALTDRTRVLFFSHITSPTGLILPAEALCALARQRGIVSVIDGAHAPGMIPVDLRRIGADLYGANCHKWMMAAPGSGFLHAAEGVRRLLRPPIASWGMDYVLDRLDEDSDWGGSFWQRSFEYMGIVDRTAQCTIPAAIDFRDAIGEANVSQRVAELTRYARRRLEGAGLKCVSRDDPRLTGAMLLFDYHEVPEPSWRNVPWWTQRKIVAPVTNHAGRYFVRVCCAWFNTEQEIDALAEVVESR
jgi:isopenicillin-N epimerase